ncbi:ATP-binding protein [Cellulomonas marina]|uniref:Histidine kinase/HSP90-like ATPase domain-containing protein n=1 Tax=Cellulomonas marina TaxID=988821 RepID=A0A1I0X4G9_9CELL|nr:ATP-binding protein [Cellulomonas marina]GIG28905.1 hypothetical protein Cma02nite_15050 [Cellulomonas marina]SFA95266.1 hypothetical protein SAMN05421867_10480 [Cellulomonas marina]
MPEQQERAADTRSEADQGLRASTPPDSFSLVHEWVIDSLTELAGLRRSLQQALVTSRRAAVDGLSRTPDLMVLVASELATNALRHGRPPTIVRLLADGDGWLLDVADHGVDTAPVLAGVREPGEGGFGLAIARKLALDVGWYATGTTKHVWAVFADTSPADGDAEPADPAPTA